MHKYLKFATRDKGRISHSFDFSSFTFFFATERRDSGSNHFSDIRMLGDFISRSILLLFVYRAPSPEKVAKRSRSICVRRIDFTLAGHLLLVVVVVVVVRRARGNIDACGHFERNMSSGTAWHPATETTRTSPTSIIMCVTSEKEEISFCIQSGETCFTGLTLPYPLNKEPLHRAAGEREERRGRTPAISSTLQLAPSDRRPFEVVFSRKWFPSERLCVFFLLPSRKRRAYAMTPTRAVIAFVRPL